MTRPKLMDTMIAAVNYPKLVEFYQMFAGLETAEKGDSYTILKDSETHQALCITNGASVERVAPGLEVKDIERAMADFERTGGKIRKRWEYASMIGANCVDPEGNEVLIWQIRG